LPPDAVSEEDTLMTKFALYVPLQAKPGKEKEVADFLRSAVPLVNDEPGTVSWFAIQEGSSSFAIFDTFDDEAGRDTHLNGKVAAALMKKIKAGDLFAKTPEIHKLEVWRINSQNKGLPCIGVLRFVTRPGACEPPVHDISAERMISGVPCAAMRGSVLCGYTRPRKHHRNVSKTLGRRLNCVRTCEWRRRAVRRDARSFA
jgi:quinol monooxygenase YgiN